MSIIDHSAISIPEGLQLADPNFDVPDKVDMLLGSDVFWELFTGQIMRLN
jgi:hypothetical protein